jgi:tetratricopeptide (TPR) repeat protein
MALLRIYFEDRGGGQIDARLDLARDPGESLAAVATLQIPWSRRQAEDLRWYLEEYIFWPGEAVREIAGRLEKGLEQAGCAVFEQLFMKSEPAKRIWRAMSHSLEETDIEIVDERRQAEELPWEILRESEQADPLAVRCRSFSHLVGSTVSPAAPVVAGEGLRILLVIARPRLGEDVPFRSVAGRILGSLDAPGKVPFQLNVLRPPTLSRLRRALQEAVSEGRAYTVVHFDGHGTYFDLEHEVRTSAGENRGTVLRDASHPLYPHRMQPGTRGYLFFEDPATGANYRIVDGAELGEILAEAGVRLLLLNACRSARSEPRAAPRESSESLEETARAWGSLAHEVIAAGVPQVVAMRHAIHVATAAQYVGGFYDELARGATVASAVTAGRRSLFHEPFRSVGLGPCQLQDWVVPVLYHDGLSQRPLLTGDLKLAAGVPSSDEPPSGHPAELPPPPVTGFVGRDRELLAVDRAFDDRRAVLVYGDAGSGKTSLAIEFGSWYRRTAARAGPVLFTAFESCPSLSKVLAEIGEALAVPLRAFGLDWHAADDRERRSRLLSLMERLEILWVWDSIENIAGFPVADVSSSREQEQEALVGFAREAVERGCRLLMTSRRKEGGLLGSLSKPVPMAPMPWQERIELAAAAAAMYGRDEIPGSWLPLLRFSRGNPLTIRLTVGFACRQEITNERDVGAFLQELQSGGAELEDEQEQGRSRSLDASLAYGFTGAFSEPELTVLSLLHLFRGVIDLGALWALGHEDNPWALGAFQKQAPEALGALLETAAEIGFLSPIAPDFYRIHAALPRFLKREYLRFHGDDARPLQAFCWAYEGVAIFLSRWSEESPEDGVRLLALQEENLLSALSRAPRHGQTEAVGCLLQALEILFRHQGRRIEWRELLDGHAPEPPTDSDGLPPENQEESWSLLLQSHVRLARQERRFDDAERLERLRLEVARRRARREPEGVRDRNLATSLHELAEIQRERGDTGCIETYKEAFKLLEATGDRHLAAACSLNLGHAYEELHNDIDRAEAWYLRALERTEASNRRMRAAILGSLGNIALLRAEQIWLARGPLPVREKHLKEARRLCEQSRDMLTRGAPGDLAVIYNVLGRICTQLFDFDAAFRHYGESIRNGLDYGDTFGVGAARLNTARMLAAKARLLGLPSDAIEDSLAFARSAAADLCASQDRRSQEQCQEAKELVKELESTLREADSS